MSQEKKTPEEIVTILHSIKEIKLDSNGELDTLFQDSTSTEGIRGFVPGSFTRELLELIEDHLLNGERKR